MTESSAFLATAERYERAVGKRWTYHYVLSKLRHDPATAALLGLGDLGEVLDIGCGRGQLAIYLLANGAATRVRGHDWDAAKIGMAQRASEGLPATFETGDVRATESDSADTVLLIDVLHYLAPKEQDVLLERAIDLVRPGGRLVVRDASAGFGWRSFVTLFVEWISTAIRFNVGDGVAFRDWPNEVVPRLAAKGIRCSVTPCWQGTPFANVLVVAEKPAQPLQPS